MISNFYNPYSKKTYKGYSRLGADNNSNKITTGGTSTLFEISSQKVLKSSFFIRQDEIKNNTNAALEKQIDFWTNFSHSNCCAVYNIFLNNDNGKPSLMVELENLTSWKTSQILFNKHYLLIDQLRKDLKQYNIFWEDTNFQNVLFNDKEEFKIIDLPISLEFGKDVIYHLENFTKNSSDMLENFELISINDTMV